MMKVRRYKKGEEEELWFLFYETVHKVNSQHYLPEQLEAWAPNKIAPDDWTKRLEKTNPFVVDANGQLVGFAELENNGYINFFYTHYKWQGKGVGKLLLEAIYKEAAKTNSTWLFTAASITSKGFFLENGFNIEKEQIVSARGVNFKNFAMVKSVGKIIDNQYVLSTDKTKLDLNLIHMFLCNESYWATGRSLETVRKSIQNSLCFGLYSKHNKMIGFARVVSDFSVFAQILDVFIVKEYRNMGIGKKLIERIMKHPELRGLQRWGLNTKDAHELYSKFGFSKLKNADFFMELVNAPK